MKKIKKNSKVDPGNVIAGEYIPDVSTKQGKIIIGQYTWDPWISPSQGKVIAGRYFEFVRTNPNIIL